MKSDFWQIPSRNTIKAIKLMRRILVLSPHLDDAVLSCCDHILDIQKNNRVFVISIFTGFGENSDNVFIKIRLKESGFSAPSEQEISRKNEDKITMTKLKVGFSYLDFIDAGYRLYKGESLYPGSNLFSGNISTYDLPLLTKLAKKLGNYQKYDKIIVPLGLGQHVDHLITKKVAEQVFEKENIAYYLDFPYALKLNNWNLQNLRLLLFSKSSKIPMSRKKKAILNCLSSQINILFGDRIPHYSERLFNR